MKTTKSYYKDLIYKVNGAAIEVHREPGPGLLESVYHKCIQHELRQRGIKFTSEMPVAVSYKGINIDTHLRCDLFIEDSLVVELKAVENISPLHESQILTYMHLLKSPIGLLLNFNCSNIFREGQKTYVSKLYRDLS